MTYTDRTLDRTCMWLDYQFQVYNRDVDWSKVPETGGVYIFALLQESSWQWIPLYIGETESFADRFPAHNKWREAMRLGVSHVHVLEVNEEDERKGIEKELGQSYAPRLNEQYW